MNGRNKLLKIGEIARKSGKTIRTIHYYENLGLIEPVGYTKGGFRLFEEGILAKIRSIENLQKAGMTLADIQLLNEIRKQKIRGGDATQRLKNILDDKIEEINEKINCLQQVNGELSFASSILGACKPCDIPISEADCPKCTVREDHSEVVDAFL